MKDNNQNHFKNIGKCDPNETLTKYNKLPKSWAVYRDVVTIMVQRNRLFVISSPLSRPYFTLTKYDPGKFIYDNHHNYERGTGSWVSRVHWGRVTHICVGKLTILGSDNGLSPGRRQAIIWINAGILLIGPLGTNFSEILIGIQIFSFKEMRLKMSSAKWRPFCLGLTEVSLREANTVGIHLSITLTDGSPSGNPWLILVIFGFSSLFLLVLDSMEILWNTLRLISWWYCNAEEFWCRSSMKTFMKMPKDFINRLKQPGWVYYIYISHIYIISVPRSNADLD